MNSKIIALTLCTFFLEGHLIHAEERIEQERVQIERMGAERIAQEQLNRKGFNPNVEEQERAQRFAPRMGAERIAQEQLNRKGFNPNVEEQERAQRFAPRMSAESSLQCPDLTSWSGESPYQGWYAHVHHHYLPLNPTWYAYDAWILANPKYFKQWAAQCNYIALSSTGEVIGKVTFGRALPQGAKSYQFAGTTYQKLSKTGIECSPWKKGDHTSKNSFPSQCAFIIRTTAGAE